VPVEKLETAPLCKHCMARFPASRVGFFFSRALCLVRVAFTVKVGGAH
jgi:hypothetical protein